MELMKKETAAFKYRDITIHVRTRATIADKIRMDAIEHEGARALRAGGTTKEVLASMGRQVVRVFADGWDGVSEGGKPVPYSYEALETGLPAAMADELLFGLSKFVTAHVDILK